MEKWSLTPAGSLLVLVRWMHIIKTGREKKKEKEKKTGNKQTNKQTKNSPVSAEFTGICEIDAHN